MTAHVALIGVLYLIVAVVFYLLGVHAGKRYERRRLTLEFNALIVRALHLAAKQDYKQLHFFLQELVADQEVLDEIRRQHEQEPEDGQEVIERARTQAETKRQSAPQPSEPEE